MRVAPSLLTRYRQDQVPRPECPKVEAPDFYPDDFENSSFYPDGLRVN